jgi:hypothetical protein
LDLGGVPPGYYALRATAKIADEKQAIGQQIILIDAEERVDESGKTITVPRVMLVDPITANLPEGIDLQIGDGPAAPKDDTDGHVSEKAG